MYSEFDDFFGSDSMPVPPEPRDRPAILRDLLAFEYGGELFALLAACVDSVVPWRPFVPVPGADARVQGVFQDRGRVIVLMAHPTGQRPKALAEAKRIIVCGTPHGHIGLPAFATKTVGPVELSTEPSPLSIHDSLLGPFTYLDPTRFADRP